MPRVIDQGYIAPNIEQKVIRQDDLLVVKTVHHDDKNLERNKALRNEGYIDKAKLGLHDNEDIRMFISCPDTLQWSIFKKKHPDIYKMIHAKDEATRMSGCRRLQFLHPAWVVQERL